MKKKRSSKKERIENNQKSEVIKKRITKGSKTDSSVQHPSSIWIINYRLGISFPASFIISRYARNNAPNKKINYSHVKLTCRFEDGETIEIFERAKITFKDGVQRQKLRALNSSCLVSKTTNCNLSTKLCTRWRFKVVKIAGVEKKGV